MATRYGSFGWAGAAINGGWWSTGIVMGANEYPVTVQLVATGDNGFYNNSPNPRYMTIGICESNGGSSHETGAFFVQPGSWEQPGIMNVSGATNLAGKEIFIYLGNPDSCVWMNSATVVITTALSEFPIYLASATGGTATCSHNFAAPGTIVTLTATPATGYRHVGWTNTSGITITGNRFSMPASAITITPIFAKITYTITPSVTPSGAGIITVAATAQAGDTVSISQTPAAGYYFNGWGGDVTITNGQFTMPSRNVSVIARYLRRSTGNLDKSTLQGGTDTTLTISSESAAYTHQYQLSFGTGMDTGLQNVAAGVNSVQISIPTSWADEIPNAQSKTGGTLVIKTFSGNTEIGSYTITGLTYQVPADAAPTAGTVTGSVLRTVNGHTYAYTADIYVQSHSGITVGVGVCSGKYSATIESVRVQVNGYSGQDYDRTYTTGLDQAITFNSGALTIAGPAVITVSVTDSRGLVTTETLNITVTAYASPTITALDVWRVDAGGDPDDFGAGAQYSYAYSYSQIGDNAAHAVLTSQGTSVTDPPASDWLMPNDHKNYSTLHVYDVTLTVTDLFETVSMTAVLPSGRFIMHFSADGDSVAFGHAVTKTPGTGYTGTFEIDENMEIWVGNMTLKAYIQGIINGTI